MKRSAEETSGTIIFISELINDIGEEITGNDILLLDEDEKIKKLEMLIETNSHYESVLLTLLWSYGKITNEELLFGKLPKRLV